MDVVSPEFQAYLRSIEAKVKYVRTPAGEERYGKPIGSPIEGGNPARAAERTSAAAVRAARRAGDTGAGPGAVGPGDGAVDAIRAPKWSAPKTVEAQTTWGTPTTTIDQVFTHPSGVRVTVKTYPGYNPGTMSNNHQVTVHDDKTGRKVYDDTFAGRPIEDIRSIAEDLVQQQLRNRPELSPSKQGHFFDYYEGRYGEDWVFGDEKKKPFNVDDLNSRKQWAAMESDNLGVIVGGSIFNGQTYTPNIDAHELTNTVLRTYETIWPGFSKLIPQVFVAPQKSNPVGTGNWIAYNALRAPYKYGEVTGYHSPTVYPKPDGSLMHVMYDHTVMALSDEYFGNSSGDIYKRMGDAATASSEVNWSSINMKGLAEKNGLQAWEIGMLKTLNHELGHTIGRMGTGELGAPGMKYNRESYQFTFLGELEGVLRKYDVLKMHPSMDMWTHVDTGGQQAASDSQKAAAILDQPKIKNLLSEYGTSSLHEMMAEAWASYMLDDHPTMFATEIATLMENNMVSYLDDLNKALKKKAVK